MSMPKGYKSDQGYATVSGEGGGMDYRAIAELMSEDGHRMNHATARNIFLRAMKKLAQPLCEMYGIDAEPGRLNQLSRDPRFQSSMIEMVTDIYASPDEPNEEVLKSPSIKIEI
jgi:hypothetical protein